MVRQRVRPYLSLIVSEIDGSRMSPIDHANFPAHMLAGFCRAYRPQTLLSETSRTRGSRRRGLLALPAATVNGIAMKQKKAARKPPHCLRLDCGANETWLCFSLSLDVVEEAMQHLILCFQTFFQRER
jgi:hypothetical protein